MAADLIIILDWLRSVSMPNWALIDLITLLTLNYLSSHIFKLISLIRIF